jgi:drug/metabolite transporter superfamily protein YnfA
MKDDRPNDPNEFVTAARSERTGLVREFLGFLAHNKKWWLLPILIVLLLFGLLLILGGTAAGPFIYPLF